MLLRLFLIVVIVGVVGALGYGLIPKSATQGSPISNVEAATSGFDQFGYNNTARLFNGTGSSWCQGKLGWTKVACDSYMGSYANDKLVMKWNEEWNRGNSENWSNPPYDAWTDNEWNGRVNGSGEIWHYKIAWDKGCSSLSNTPSGTTAKGTAYCIWGPFAMLMSQGSVSDHSHSWDVLLKPAGY